jgi:thiamine-monophosphate kinase
MAPAMAEGPKHGSGDRLGEFDIIARYFGPLATDKAALGLRDDAAVLLVSEGHELVATCDTLIEGVHFLKDDPPDTIGHKALAVNLSDLAAKGARGCAYLLSLALPCDVEPAWLEGFSSGLRALQEKTGIGLVGGDTTASPGPLTITISALGLVPHGRPVLRHGAQIGDRLYVSGTIGDAHLGLRLLKEPSLARTWGLSDDDKSFLVDRYRRPNPPTGSALLIRNFAQAAIDVSDGLIGDIVKLCAVSHVGALVETSRVPFSAAAQKALDREPELLKTLITAGDDYEVVLAISEGSASDFEAEAKSSKAAFTPIGTVLPADRKVSVQDREGRKLSFERTGFSHF